MEALETRVLLDASSNQSTYMPPRHDKIQVGGFLTAPTPGDPRDVAIGYLSAHAADFGLDPADISQARITDQYTDPDTKTTHIYLRETFNGLEISNANLNINLTADNRVINVGETFVTGLSRPIGMAPVINPTLSAGQAIEDAAAQLGLHPTSSPSVVAAGLYETFDHGKVLHAGGVSLDPVPARLHYVASPSGLELAWNLVLRTPGGGHWYNASVNASTGTIVANNDWIDHASYNVIAPPAMSPDDGSRAILTNPQDPVASPFGWHDTNGATGAEFTDTRGNNVWAQEDADADNAGGFRPSGGTNLNFNFPLDLTQDPSAYQPAAITQLFYMNNLLHDIHYHYGFTEAAGNFQTNDYNRGGTGGDPVMADAQDGSGTDNANFATPPDGISPRMQMYVFYSTYPIRDGDLDNGVIIHEYGHGISNRLTGGPANSDALSAQQSGGMGEGWSDWWAMMLTMRPGDTANTPRGLGTYVEGQPTDGTGIRSYPYCFDMNVNPTTLGFYNSNNEVHAAGEIWCSALWDMSWLLVNRYGFSANLAAGYTGAGSAGNTLALKLVMDALKLQPVNPTFTEARDAILQADLVLTGGANQDLLWQAFARRGLGLSANCGADANSPTVTEAFDLPPSDPIVMGQTPDGRSLGAPRSVQFRFTEPMDPTSFSVADDVVSFTGPGGVNLLSQITGFAWLDNRTLQVDFTRQTTEGDYSMVIGPRIVASDNGHAMDQDRDGIPGESTQDRYTADFKYSLGYVASPTPFESIDLEAGQAGVFTIVDGLDDGTASVNLGTNSFNFYGKTYTGSSKLFVSANGLITFGSADSSALQTDLTTDPTQAAIAPLWSDWRTDVDANDKVLGKFDDVNHDGVPDRLIVEWSQVPYYYLSTQSSLPVTFQAILQLNTGSKAGDIVFNYPDTDAGLSFVDNGGYAAVGIKDSGAQGDNRLLVSFDDGSNPLIGSGKAIRLGRPVLTPYQASSTPYQSIDLVPGAPGVFSVVDGVDDDVAPIDLGANTFNFYGATYAGPAMLFASSNGLLTFGSGYQFSDNTDLLSTPNLAAIAPLWDDWRTDVDANDQVLGRFDDLNGDGVADRLIVEWNRVQHYETTPSDVTFQAILQLNTGATPGAITFNYPDLDTGDIFRNGSSATVGIKDAGPQGDNWLLVSYADGSNPLIGSGKAIRIDASTVAPTGSIAGQVYNDANGNGAKDAGEAGLSGWTVYIDSNNNGAKDAGEPTAVSDASGGYNFVGLAAGTYVVREVAQAGWTQTAPTSGGRTVALAAGQSVVGQDFGDVRSVPSLAISDVTITEGNSGTKSAVFTVTLSAASASTVTVGYATADGTALAGSDYTAASGVLSFTPGVTSRTIAVPIKGDALYEADETFTVALSNASGATIGRGRAAGTIVNDDLAPTVSISGVTTPEGNSGSHNAAFKVTLTKPSGLPTTIHYFTTNGTAVAGSDYASTTGTVTIPAGALSALINVPVFGDLASEPNESFVVTMDNVTGAVVGAGKATGVIVNDDNTLSINNVSKLEGNSGQTAFTFTVTLSQAATFPVTVHYKTTDGTATAASGDYVAIASGTLTFSAGQTTKTITVFVNGDTVVEPNETFFVNLSGATNATIKAAKGTGTILDEAATGLAAPVGSFAVLANDAALDALGRSGGKISEDLLGLLAADRTRSGRRHARTTLSVG